MCNTKLYSQLHGTSLLHFYLFAIMGFVFVQYILAMEVEGKEKEKNTLRALSTTTTIQCIDHQPQLDESNKKDQTQIKQM